MTMVRYLLASLLFALALPANAQLISLAYHDIVDGRHDDPYALTRAELREHLEFFKNNGYQPISLNYLKQVKAGRPGYRIARYC